MSKHIIYLILILIFLTLYLKYKYENYPELFEQQKNAVCFIIRNLNDITLEFAEECAMYSDVYIIVDDNKQKIKLKKGKVKILQINNDLCKKNNYIKSTWRFNEDVTGWDKAFYYFCENNNYDNVWFIEDDVFVPTADTFVKIDQKYGKVDFLCNLFNYVYPKSTNPNNAWKEKLFDGHKYMNHTNLHWTWVCAMRCSKKLLSDIKKIKKDRGELFFHEILIATIVKNNNLTYKKIPELQNIIYRKIYKSEDIVKNDTLLYHPIKDYNEQNRLRQLIKNKLK